MLKRPLVLATMLLLMQLAPISAQEQRVVTPSDALWRFDTHG